MLQVLGAVAAVVNIVIVAALVVFVSRALSQATAAETKSREEHLTLFAQNTGLTMAPGTTVGAPTLFGVYAGFPVRLLYEIRGGGTRSVGNMFTVMLARLPIRNHLTLRICPKWFAAKNDESRGTREFETGDAPFDKTFRVETSSPADVALVVTPEITRRAMAVSPGMVLRVKPGVIAWEQPGFLKDEHQLENVLEMITLIAREVLALEAPHLLEAAQPRTEDPAPVSDNAQTAGPGASSSTRSFEQNTCQSCGGTLERDIVTTNEAVRCPYCGFETNVTQ